MGQKRGDSMGRWLPAVSVTAVMAALIVGVALGSVVRGTGAQKEPQGEAKTRITACIAGNRVMKIAAKGACPESSTRTVRWNKQGPPDPRGPQGPRGEQGEQGEQGEPGQPGATLLWAKVDADGTLLSGHGVDEVIDNHSGFYTLVFDRDVGPCATTVTPRAQDVIGSIRFSSTDGLLDVQLQELASGNDATAPFSVIVACPE